MRASLRPSRRPRPGERAIGSKEYAVNLSVWTYPWDVADEGVDQVLGNIRDVAKCNGVSLASAYHNFKQLRPHGPAGRRIYVGEGGVVYFRPNLSRYGRIKPVPSKLVDEIDAFRAVCDARGRFGMDVSAWTVIMHNTRLATANPDCAMHTALGDPLPHQLCPSNPNSREFAVALCADLAHSYDLRTIELESVGFLPFQHGYHHDKIGAPLGAWGIYLLGICFCDSCLNRASSEGIDGRRMRDSVRDELDLLLAGESDSPPSKAAAEGMATWRRETPEFLRYLGAGDDAVLSLIGEIQKSLKGTGTRLILQGEPFESHLDGQAIKRAVQQIDGLLVGVYNMTPEQAKSAVARAKEIAGNSELIVGVQSHSPEIPSSEIWQRKVKICREGGATGLNFYNYGICTMSQLRGVGKAAAAA